MSMEYPSEKDLEKITNWDFQDSEGLIKFVEFLWSYPSYIKKENGKWFLSTGGWSGNEDVVDALQRNMTWWASHWESSRRGGHYEFRI